MCILNITNKYFIYFTINNMKKLLLLSALLIFACGSDDSSDNDNGIREFLNSNIFSIEYDECIVLMIWPPQECANEWTTERFFEFTLDDNDGIVWKTTTLKNYPFYCDDDVNTSQCYFDWDNGSGEILYETNDIIILQLIDYEELYLLTRNGNSISIVHLNQNPTSSISPLQINEGEYLLSSQENLDQRKSERNDFICPSSCGFN